MKENDSDKLHQLATALLADYFVYAPIKQGETSVIKEVKDLKSIDWSGRITSNPWKEIILPHRERLFDLTDAKTSGLAKKIAMTKGVQPPVACLGMNILDLKALTLTDIVFGNDVYYQNRRQNIIIVGFSADWPAEYKALRAFSQNFEQTVLNHVGFDIFIAGLGSKQKPAGANAKQKFYSGSEKGRKLLEKYSLKDFDHIEFTGAVAESGPDKRMMAIAGQVEKSYEHGLWNTLNDICLACGKCSIVCPTCFCFNLVDRVDPDNCRRDRTQGNCFYNDFSKVAGNTKELDTVKKKIFFWYTHKFVRIPKEYGLPGCVACGRCVKACPVGIDIVKNIAKLAKIKVKSAVKSQIITKTNKGK